MADRNAPPLYAPLTSDLAGVLAAAQQRKAEAVGRSFQHAATLVGLPTRVCRMLVQAWLRRLEKRIQSAVGTLDRAGLLEDSPRGRYPTEWNAPCARSGKHL